jgi:hypothetical protein
LFECLREFSEGDVQFQGIGFSLGKDEFWEPGLIEMHSVPQESTIIRLHEVGIVANLNKSQL